MALTKTMLGEFSKIEKKNNTERNKYLIHDSKLQIFLKGLEASLKFMFQLSIKPWREKAFPPNDPGNQEWKHQSLLSGEVFHRLMARDIVNGGNMEHGGREQCPAMRYQVRETIVPEFGLTNQQVLPANTGLFLPTFPA